MDKTKVFEAAGKFAAKGQLDKAAKEYQRILEEDPKDVRALQKLAEIFQKANKNKEATDLMLRVVGARYQRLVLWVERRLMR